MQARFDGPRFTGDGGLCWLAETGTALGLSATLAAHIPQWRHGPVQHALESLMRQRVFQIAHGYEDQNAAATLRADALLKLVRRRARARAPVRQPSRRTPLAPPRLTAQASMNKKG